MRPRAAGCLALLAACSNLATTDGGVASVEIVIPSPAEVEAGGTIQLIGVARGSDGEPLEVPIYWRALDTTIAVDSVAGLLSGVQGGATGRVVARAVDLYSTIATFTVLKAADTLIRVGDSALTVPAATTASPTLSVRVEGGDPPAAVDRRRVTFELISPAFATPEDRTVEFLGGLLATSVVTSTNGAPSPAVTLNRREGRTAPDTAVVQVSVYRPGGGTVAGSGQRFIVLFAR